MKRLRRAVAIAVIFCMLIPSIAVFAADTWKQYFPITITNAGAALSSYPVLIGSTGQSMVDAGYMTATGTDTRMKLASTNQKYMLSTTEIATVAGSLSAGGQVTHDLYTGYAPVATTFPVIVGEGGYLTIPDAAGLELGAAFELEITGGVDTSAGAVGENLEIKAGSYRTYNSGVTDITSEIKQGQPIVGGVNRSLNNVNTEYSSIMGGMEWDVAENQVYQVMPTAGYFCRLYIELDAVVAGGATETFTLMKNGAPTALTVTIAAGASTGNDTTHSVAYVAADTISLRAVPTGVPGAPNATWSSLFVPDTYGETIFLAHSIVDSGAPRFFASQGGMTSLITTLQFSTPMPCAGTFGDAYVQLSAAPGAGSYTCVFNVNGGNTAINPQVVNPATTGSDTAASVPVVAGDLVNWEVYPGGGAAANPEIAVGVVFTPTVIGEYPILGSTADQPAVAAVEYYHMTPGDAVVWQAVEATVPSLTQFCTLKDLYVKVDPAPGGAFTYTLAIREEAGATGLTVTITGAATTGNDLVNEFTSTTGDTVGVQCTGDGGAATNVKWGVVAYNPDVSVTATGVASGEMTVTTGIERR